MEEKNSNGNKNPAVNTEVTIKEGKANVEKKEEKDKKEKSDVKGKELTLKLKKPVIIAIIVILLLLCLGTVVVFYLLTNGKKKEEEISEKTEETGEENGEEELPETGEELEVEEDGDGTDGDGEAAPTHTDQDRIVYIKNHNVWIVNNDGTGKKQMTTDGSDSVKYDNVDFRYPGIISYSKCSGECRVYTKDISSGDDELIVEMMPFTQAVTAARWSHDGEKLAYKFIKGDGSKDAVLWTETSSITLHSYAPPGFHMADLNAGVDIEFSPNDKRILLFDSYVDSTFDKPVIVYNDEGTKLIEMTDATFPTFADNDNFYYKIGDELRMWRISSSTSYFVIPYPVPDSYGFKTSCDSYFIAYWDGSAPSDITLLYHDTGGSSSAIADNYAGPEWLDSDSKYLVAVKAPELTATGYQSEGLAKLGRVDGSVLPLDDGEIYEFDVE